MAYTVYTTLSVAVVGRVATITFNNPPINLMDLAMFGDLDRVGRELEADTSISVVVLESANPEFFIAHADVNLLIHLPAAPERRDELLWASQGALHRFRTMPKATIAKIAGRCRGVGNELALACDMRFAALETAIFCQPEVGGGVIPGGGGSTRLPRLIGRGRALEIILGSGDIDAVTAEKYGMINRALPQLELGAFVDELAERIAGFSSEAIALAKEAVSTDTLTVEESLLEEERLFFESVAHPASKARMSRVLEAGFQTHAVECQSVTSFWSTLD